MSDAPRSDPRPAVDGPAVELSSEPVVLNHGVSEDDALTTRPDLTDGDRPARHRRSRRRRIVLGAVLAVALAGGAGLGSVGWRIAQQKDATLSTPLEVAGLRQDNSVQARETADYLRSGLVADIAGVDDSVGVVYADPADPDRSVLLFGGTGLVWQPERDLDRLFTLASEGTATDLRRVEAGPLGGVMKCGVSRGDGGDIAVCGWADHGSIVMGMFPGRDLDEAAALLRTIRDAIQRRD
jgi:hypothetical protein